ncbi:MAG: ABC transporter permease [Comamonadaceae bacterium]|nr:ABC transporter permease [Comamonadaceae bacterium]
MGSGSAADADRGRRLRDRARGRRAWRLAAPHAARRGRRWCPATRNWATQIFGTDHRVPGRARLGRWPPAAPFEPSDDRRGAGKVALIGQTVARRAVRRRRPGRRGDPRAQACRSTVIGVLERKGQSTLGQDQDDVVLMPISTARNRVLGQAAGPSCSASARSRSRSRDGADMNAAEQEMRDLLRQRHRVQPSAGGRLHRAQPRPRCSPAQEARQPRAGAAAGARSPRCRCWSAASAS